MRSPISSSRSIQSSDGLVNHSVKQTPAPNVEPTLPPKALTSSQLNVAQNAIQSSHKRASKQCSRSRYNLCKRITIAALTVIGFMTSGYFLHNPIDQAINPSSSSTFNLTNSSSCNFTSSSSFSASLTLSMTSSTEMTKISTAPLEEDVVTPNIFRARGIRYVNSGDMPPMVVSALMYGNDTATYYGSMTFKRTPPTGWIGNNPYNTIVTSFENDVSGIAEQCNKDSEAQGICGFRSNQLIRFDSIEEIRVKFSFTSYTPNSVLTKPRMSLFKKDPALSHTIYALNTSKRI